jgi:hypothetical protein
LAARLLEAGADFTSFVAGWRWFLLHRFTLFLSKIKQAISQSDADENPADITFLC